ncbi:bis(5'-nucleosyl)-tetraphosphatase (symmetrical) [Streptohalobacillus salinus]|uniref:Bis(5'-nucleosyl)-tetraphosphatase (Symmetrical) n=1 Tax=Streptohalobacillus salinus TaxID=621096 RepID=A0A2V3WDZ2_9BACI|nr:metallophosphoesterase [Streptohalobacillus salinus]PXW93136.1 bis(5'-nucleosyl)-tetraphosphatase (symmetrical) [Streptohalobacillus salinus]
MNYDVIGDVHGCYDELVRLLTQLGYREVDGHINHKDMRKLIFVGDLTDRGPQSLNVIRLVYRLVMKDKIAHYVPGNHCNKLYRYFLGNNVEIKHGLETTIHEYLALNARERHQIKDQFKRLYQQAPLYFVAPHDTFVVAHAGIMHDMIGREDEKVKKFVLYGVPLKETYPDGRPKRLDWSKHYQGKHFVIYGHTPVLKPYQSNHTLNIDLGCVFGHKLCAYRVDQEQFITVNSKQPFQPDRFTSFD